MAEQRELENVQRWTSKRRMALVLSIVRGETSAKEAARKHGLTLGGHLKSGHTSTSQNRP